MTDQYVAFSKTPPRYVFEGMIWERETDKRRFDADIKGERWIFESKYDKEVVPFAGKSTLFIACPDGYKKLKIMPKEDKK